jgi:hypothetical protein
VLTAPPFQQTWKAPRDFPAMAGELRVLETLTPEAVAAWLQKLAGAPC